MFIFIEWITYLELSIYVDICTETKTTELEMRDKNWKRVALENAKLKLFKLFSSNYNALSEGSKLFAKANLVVYKIQVEGQ